MRFMKKFIHRGRTNKRRKILFRSNFTKGNSICCQQQFKTKLGCCPFTYDMFITEIWSPPQTHSRNFRSETFCVAANLAADVHFELYSFFIWNDQNWDGLIGWNRLLAEKKKTLFWKMWTLIGSLFGQIGNLRCFRFQSNHSLLPREVPWHRRFWRCASIRRLVKWNRQKRNLFTKKHSISQNKQKLHKFSPPVSSEAK